jgi:hypothetical protein
MKAGAFRSSLMASTICRLRILSLAFVKSRLFSDFPGTMTLAMTLDAKDFPAWFGGNLTALEKRPQKLDQARGCGNGADVGTKAGMRVRRSFCQAASR